MTHRTWTLVVFTVLALEAVLLLAALAVNVFMPAGGTTSWLLAALTVLLLVSTAAVLLAPK